jgi:hypothetical protein
MNEQRRPTARGERLFFTLAGVWFVALPLVGFGPTFYFRRIPEPLPTHQVVHGVLFSAWVVLFLVQALLITTRHVRWHMKLGMASVAVLLLMLPAGFYVVLVKAAAGLKGVDDAGGNLTSLTFGFGLAFAGLVCRRRPFVHKRLMLFATLMLTLAAADRVSSIVGLDDVRLFRKVLAVVPGVALVVFDALGLRRIPLLSLSALTMVWLLIWFTVSDLVFARPCGEIILNALTRVFVW